MPCRSVTGGTSGTTSHALRSDQHELLAKTTSAGPEMSQLAALVRAFAQLLTPADGNAERLQEWINTTEQMNLPHVHSFIRGLRLDQCAVHAALTSEHRAFHRGQPPHPSRSRVRRR